MAEFTMKIDDEGRAGEETPAGGDLAPSDTGAAQLKKNTLPERCGVRGSRPKLDYGPRRERFYEALNNGLQIRECCTYAGVAYDTYRKYLNQGELDYAEERDTPYREFFVRVQEIEMGLEMDLTKAWVDMAKKPKDHRSIKEFMEARWPDRWRPTQRIDVTHRDVSETTVQSLTLIIGILDEADKLLAGGLAPEQVLERFGVHMIEGES